MSTQNITENDDCIYFTMVSNYNNQLDSTSKKTLINQSGLNTGIKLSDYNLYLTSLNLTISELPYFNIKKSIVNFATNQTNMSISLISPNAGDRPFDLALNTNLLISGIGNSTGSTFQGAVCFLQYQSENSNATLYPDPSNAGNGANSSSYPLNYFSVHSIGEVMDMINVAIQTLLSKTASPNDTFYISYDAASELYSFSIDVTYIANYQMYVNGFLERILDAFRWKFYSDTLIGVAGYTGLNYLFVPQTSNLALKTNTVWSFPCEYSVVSNLIDIVSVVVVSDGIMSGVRKEYIPVNLDTQNPTSYLPSKPVLKNLDILLSSNLSASSNNSNIVYEAPNLDRPINTYGVSTLDDIKFSFYYQDIENNLFEIYQPSISASNIKFCLKKIKK